MPAIVGGMLAAAAAAVFGATLVNGDTVFHLAWGRELVEGGLTSFSGGPTPHPLPLLAGAATSLAGEAASYSVTYAVFGPISFGLLAAAGYAAARELAGTWWAGGLAVLLLSTSTPVLASVATARYDVLFAALVVGALTIEMRRTEPSSMPLALLVVSGLLRPEGWFLAGAYVLYRLPALAAVGRLTYLAAAASAPILWMLMDLGVMGDPLYSWQVTEHGSDVFYRQYTVGENLAEAGRNLLQYTGPVVLGLACLAVVAALRRRERRSLVTLGALFIPLGIFLALLARGTASSERYLLLPACLLIVLASAFVCRRPRTPGMAMGVTLGIVLLLYVQHPRLDNPATIRAAAQDAQAQNESLEALVGRAGVQEALRDCRVAGVPTTRMVPVAAFHSHRSPADWRVDDRGRTRPQVYLVPASDAAREILTRRRFDDDESFVLPSGLVAGPRTEHWRAYGDPKAACAAGLLAGP